MLSVVTGYGCNGLPYIICATVAQMYYVHCDPSWFDLSSQWRVHEYTGVGENHVPNRSLFFRFRLTERKVFAKAAMRKLFINFGVVKWAIRISYHEWQKNKTQKLIKFHFLSIAWSFRFSTEVLTLDQWLFPFIVPQIPNDPAIPSIIIRQRTVPASSSESDRGSHTRILFLSILWI